MCGRADIAITLGACKAALITEQRATTKERNGCWTPIRVPRITVMHFLEATCSIGISKS
jgi:hypothetical protein